MVKYEVYDKDSGTSVQYDGDREEARKYLTEVVNLRKLVYEQLESVEGSMEAAKRTLDQIQAQIREVRVKLESTTGRTGGIILDWEEQADLERLKKEVRALKYRIPYSLVYPSPPSVFLADDPNVVWHPRTSSTSIRTRARDDNTYRLLPETSPEDMDWKLSHKCNPNFYFLQCPTFGPREDLSLSSLQYSRALQCLKQFPRGVFIKRTLLLNCFRALPWSSSLDDALIYCLVRESILKTICKRSTNTVSSYWFNEDNLISFYEPRWRRLPDDSIHLSPLPSEEHGILYSDNRRIMQERKSVQVLLLGKWHRSLPLSQHIEVADPDLFYKGMENLTEVKYISLRGISMIPEIPQFITKLKKLQILDCKACHNLEVIPDNINKLWRTLTHLDVSECHLLDHMPASLSDLIHLQVLKGFHLGEPGQQRKSCTLRNLTKLSKLHKLHLSTSVKGFPNTDHLADLQKFRSLRNLGISWRGCQTHAKSTSFSQRVLTHKDSIGGGGGDQQQFSFNLEKLDLQCVPNTVTRVWLNPVVFKGLKKLYITGGSFSDLGQNLDEQNEEIASVIAKENQWTVEILRLKHLRNLKMNMSELYSLFPKLKTLDSEDFPNLI